VGDVVGEGFLRRPVFLDRPLLVRQAILRNRQVLGDKVRKDLADLFRREPPDGDDYQ